MHFVVMGCGRVGASLARTLDRFGHTVAVIDQDPTAFRRLPRDFSGTTVVGKGFDREVLTEADTSSAYGFAAVSSGDNSNIIAARVARELFGVKHVVARIYDPGRAEIYQRLGIPTVATVRWSADQVLRRMIPQGLSSQYREPSGRLALAEVSYHESWVGRPLVDLEALTGARVAFVTRLGEAVLPAPRMLVQEGDLVHLIVPVLRQDEISALLADRAEEADE